MGKKQDRDPNAPKRNLSAYLLYQNAMREQFKADKPNATFGELSKYTSQVNTFMIHSIQTFRNGNHPINNNHSHFICIRLSIL